MLALVIAVTLLFLAVASYHDLRDGEIPDGVSITLSFLLIGMSAFTFTKGFPIALPRVLLTGAAYFLVGYVLYRLGQWGGGDVKIIAGVGLSLALLASVGFSYPNMQLMPYYISFFINMGLVSIPYVVAYSLFVSLKKPSVLRVFRVKTTNKKFLLLLTLACAVPIYAYTSVNQDLALILSTLPPYLILSVYLKSVELEALQKTIKVSELREWDVLAKNLIVDGRRISSKRSIEGMPQAKIDEIKKLAAEGKIPAEIRIKWGVKFVPIIAFAYALTLYLGNALEFIVFRISV